MSGRWIKGEDDNLYLTNNETFRLLVFNKVLRYEFVMRNRKGIDFAKLLLQCDKGK